MNEFEMTPQSAFSPTATATAERVTGFLRKVYGWMFVGLGISTAVALGLAGTARDNRIAGRVERGAAYVHPLGAKFPQQFEGVVRRFAQALQIQQSVSAEERFATVTHLVVNVANAPIREDISLL